MLKVFRENDDFDKKCHDKNHILRGKRNAAEKWICEPFCKIIKGKGDETWFRRHAS